MESPNESKISLATTVLSGILFFSSTPAEAKPPEPTHAPISVTAIAVAEAYSNAYLALEKTQMDKLIIRREEIDTQRAILSNARDKLTTPNKLLFGLISMLPSGLESALLDKIVEQSYGNLLLLRKLMIKQQIDKAIQEGTKQIVFVGAGLDIRGLYTAKSNPAVQIFELEQRSMHQTKREALRKIYSTDTNTLPTNLHLLEADVNSSWFYKLILSEKFDQTQATLYVAEGLTMYMSEEQNVNFLRGLQERMKPEDAILISFMSQIKTNAAINGSMQAQHEHFGFGLPKAASIGFLAKQGLTPQGWFASSQHLKDLGDITGSAYFANTERPEEYYLLLKRNDDSPNLALDLYDYKRITLALTPPTAEAKTPYTPIL